MTDKKPSVISIFTSQYIIWYTKYKGIMKHACAREVWISNARWYELSHDRLIAPIKDSNAVWDLAYERKIARDISKRYQKLKIIIPVAIAYY